MNTRVTRHFVTVGSRRVHYHRAGEGPAVALLHASPCSAKVLRLPLEVFATRFTAIGFDTPGFGLSDLLPIDGPRTEDFADALAETLSALGIEHAGVYGRHTGAQIAVEFAARHARRCAMALTDGFPVFSAEVRRARLDRYLQPIVPTFEGGHLLWLWFRYREQHVFWPWNEQSAASRADTDVPDVNFLHRGVIELLEAGDSYRVGYATAYRHRGLDVLADLEVPVCFGARPGDSQFSTLKRFPPGVWTREMPREALAAAQAELEALATHPATGVPPRAPACAALPGRSTTDYVDIGECQILVRSSGRLDNAHNAAPVVILHHAPGSSALYDALVCALGRRHLALAFDLPGHGESDGLPGAIQSVAEWSSALLRLLDALGIGVVHLYGHNSGAAVAVETALRAKERVRSLILDAPICLSEVEQALIAPRWLAGVGPLEPAWNGEHLLRAWHMRRDMELWWPWYARSVSNARKTEPRIDPARLTLEVREMMKQPASFAPAWDAAIRYPMRERLALTAQPCRLMAGPEDIFAHCLPLARALRPDAGIVDVQDTIDSRARAILGMSL